jgi:multiple sugar transport system permease protein
MKKKYVFIGKSAKMLFLITAAAVSFLPFWMLFIASLRGRAVLFEYPPKLWPSDSTLENYRYFFDAKNNDFMNWFKNSLIVSVSGTLLSLFVCLLAAYAFAKKKFPGKAILLALIMATMIIPGAVTLFPAFKVVKFLNLINTLPGIFITGIANVFGMLMLKQFMEGIPNSIIESAVVDGAGEYVIFFMIILPMCVSVSALLVIWCFMGNWNNLLWPMVIINTSSLKTLPVGIASMMGKNSTSWNLVMSATMLSLIPIFAVFLIFRKKFIEGMTAGAVKG